MALEKAVAFIDELRKNQELRAKVDNAESPGEALVVAKDSGFEFSVEELDLARHQLLEAAVGRTLDSDDDVKAAIREAKDGGLAACHCSSGQVCGSKCACNRPN